MKGMIRLLVVLLVISVLIGLVMFNRNSMPYRLASKVLSPITTALYSDDRKPLARSFTTKLQAPLDGWKWFKPADVDVAFGSNGLTVTALSESVWWKNDRASAYTYPVSGDVEIVARVSTTKTSSKQEYPDSDYQFGGLMLRNPAGNAIFSTENYVFNVIGFRGSKLQVETKSTINGYSKVNGYDWSSGNAELKIIRKKNEFLMFARPLDKNTPWLEVDSFSRADLPETLELSLIVYSFSRGAGRVDLTVNFEQLIVN